MKIKRLFVLAFCLSVISCEVGSQGKPVEPSALPDFIMNDGNRHPSERRRAGLAEHEFRFLKMPNPRMTQLLSQGYSVAEKPIREGISQDGELSVYVFTGGVAMVLNQRTKKLIGVYGASGDEELALIR